MYYILQISTGEPVKDCYGKLITYSDKDLERFEKTDLIRSALFNGYYTSRYHKLFQLQIEERDKIKNSSFYDFILVHSENI